MPDIKEKNKLAAQQRVDQIDAFELELAQLENERVIALSVDEKRKIKSYHQILKSALLETFDVDVSRTDKQLSLGMRIASLLGALAFAASVFFLFYRYWGSIAVIGQVVILISSPVITYFMTLWIANKDTAGYFSKLMAMICLACFILNISMLGQIFNITPSDNALLIWSIFAFLLAYACDARLLLAAGIFSFQAYIAARIGTWSGLYWLSFGERPENFLLPSIVIFTVPMWISQKKYTGFETLYRVLGLVGFFLSILVLANAGNYSYIKADSELIEGSYQVAGFVLSAGVIALGVRYGWTDVVNTGNVFFILFLYTKVFDWWWDWMPKYLFFMVVGLIALLALLVFKRLRVLSVSTQEMAR